MTDIKSSDFFVDMSKKHNDIIYLSAKNLNTKIKIIVLYCRRDNKALFFLHSF